MFYANETNVLVRGGVDFVRSWREPLESPVKVKV